MSIEGKQPGLVVDPYLADVLLADLVGHDRQPAAFCLYFWLFAMTRARGRRAAHFSYATLSDNTGLSKSSVRRAAQWLERRALLQLRKTTATSVPEYAVLTPWASRTKPG